MTIHIEAVEAVASIGLAVLFLTVAFLAGCVTIGSTTPIVENFATITILAESDAHHVPAKIDTGAKRTSISIALAERIGLEPLSETVKTVSANCKTIRPLVDITYVLNGQVIVTRASMVDRSNLDYEIIVGSDDLAGRFLVRPQRSGDE